MAVLWKPMPPVWLAALSNSMASPHQRRKLMSMGNRPSFSRETKLQWAGSRERISPSGRGGAFFLTSLFIELQWAGSRERISPSGRGGAFFLTSLFIELIDPNRKQKQNVPGSKKPGTRGRSSERSE